MASPFETVINELLNIGFYDFLLFLLALPLFFALLKKTKLLGESSAINGLVAFVGAFLIFSFPIITGTSLTFSMTTMFMQLMLFIFVIFFAFLISGFFYPDLAGMLKEKFSHSRTMLYVGVAIALTVAVISGFLPTILGAIGGSGAPTSPDIITLIGGMLIFIVVLIIAAATTLKSE